MYNLDFSAVIPLLEYKKQPTPFMSSCMFKQNQPTVSIGDIRLTIRRISMLILGCKGLILRGGCVIKEIGYLEKTIK